MEISNNPEKLNKIIIYKKSSNKKINKRNLNNKIKSDKISTNNNQKISNERRNKYKDIVINMNLNIYKNKFNMEKKKERKKTIIYINTKKNNYNEKTMMIKNNIRNIINLLLFWNLLIKALFNNNSNKLIFSNSNITLKIKGIGYKNIFGNQTGNAFEKQNYPSEININGNRQDIINHTYYFNLTENIVELVWNYSITNCTNMFRRSYDITEINLFYFDTSEVKSMWCMFFYCTSLTSLNLSSFETSNVESMAGMFQNCYSIISLNLSSFNTSKVRNLSSMFRKCQSLTSLNLSNFITSKVTRIEYMFEGCTNMEYINFYNFDEVKITNFTDMFKDIKNNIVICVNEEKNNSKLLTLIELISCSTKDCSDDWRSKQKKIINETGQCIDSCENSTIYKYEFNGQCYNNCTYGFLDNSIYNDQCKCKLEKCLLCPSVALNNNLCTYCNEDYYQMENDPSNLGDYFNCYSELKGYYLDIKNVI